jgi:predicted amino acid-binding ACT domain protein
MKTDLVLTLLGEDRAGMVQDAANLRGAGGR